MLPDMTKATRAIKVTEQAHYQLRIMAARDGEHIWELVDAAVVLLGRERAIRPKRKTATNGTRKERGK
jgi:hypothetical protein